MDGGKADGVVTQLIHYMVALYLLPGLGCGREGVTFLVFFNGAWEHAVVRCGVQLVGNKLLAAPGGHWLWTTYYIRAQTYELFSFFH